MQLEPLVLLFPVLLLVLLVNGVNLIQLMEVLLV
jgi:hypothetical protein